MSFDQKIAYIKLAQEQDQRLERKLGLSKALQQEKALQQFLQGETLSHKI
jgi:hypothetical protein